MNTIPRTSVPWPPSETPISSRTMMTTAAPRTGPHSDPAPPMMTATIARTEVVKPTSLGVTRFWSAAASEPARPARAPAMQ
jgi:hypothetical protein